MRLGLVADAREATAATVANLERFAGVFRREKVAAVVVLGGMASTEDELGRELTALKGAQAPLFALPGDREPEAAFHAAIERAKKAGLDVTDLQQARGVVGDGLVIESLPGTRWTHDLVAGGCRVEKADLEALKDLDAAMSQKGKPLVLVAHTPPRGHGPDAIDWALPGGDDGDAELARVLPSLKAQVAAFAGVDASGGRLRDAEQPLAEGAWAERLSANVGAADAAPRGLVEGRTSRGQALLVEIADGKARAKVVR